MRDSNEKVAGLLPTEAASGEAVGPGQRQGGAQERSSIGPGTVLGKYRIARKLGSGGMGSVYEAAHVEIGKAVALKTLSTHLAADPNAHARFLNEAAAASRLEHPNVANVIDYGSEGSVPYLVMELLRGEDLAQRIAREGQGLPIDETCDILLAVCAGVAAAHEEKIVHRDLKPQNIFLARNRMDEVQAKVLDFGVSKVQDGAPGIGPSLTASGAVIGTTQYMSPEQVLGGAIGPLSDQHALGVVLYECLTARRPHEGETLYLIMQSIGEGRFTKPSVFRSDLPADLEAVILRAMARDPVDRFASVHELGKALLPYASTKQRTIWSDYYTKGRRVIPSRQRDEWSLPPTAPLPPLTPARRPPPIRFPPSGSRERSATSVPMPSVSVGTTEMADRARSPWRWILALTVLVVVGGGAAALLLTGGRPKGTILVQLPEPSQPRASSLPGTEDPSLDPGSGPVGRSTAIPGDTVAITFEDAPDRLEALVDGKPAILPMRLPKDGLPHKLLFRAPGYEPKEITIVTMEDRTLRLSLHPTEADETPRTKSRASDRAKKRGREPGKSPDGKRPPPLMDI
jgi:serine/threonine-protein kinase